MTYQETILGPVCNGCNRPLEACRCAAAVRKIAEGCCGDDRWRGRFCQYHQGYYDGLTEGIPPGVPK